MKGLLYKQLAFDYCCLDSDVTDGKNHFSIHRLHQNRRKFMEDKACFLKVAVVKGKLLFCGRGDILAWCEQQYKNWGGEWFFEAKNLQKLNDRLQEDGYQIEMVHPFYIADTITEVDSKGFEVKWFEEKEIEHFRGDTRYDEAFAFSPDAPDVLGVAAVRDGQILGMAGASADSPLMWQIGINVEKEFAHAGIGTMIVTLLKNEVLRRGYLPYYGTSISHLASQRLALGAGFVPMWVELVTSKVI